MPGVEYLIQLRTKEEYDGRWSDWSTPVNGSSWTGKYTCKHAYAHEIKSSYFKIITGKWVCPCQHGKLFFPAQGTTARRHAELVLETQW